MKRRLPLPAIIGIVIGAAVTLYFFVGVTYHVIEKKLNPPPAPAVQYAEFPYRLVYEKDEEIFTVEDTLVIEFVDSGWSFELGDVYEWNRYLLSEKDLDEKERISNNQEIVLIEKHHEIDGTYPLVSFVFGSSDYLMGLKETSWSGAVVDTNILTDEEVFAKYGIRIIEKYMAPPIKNSFEDK